MMTEQALSEQTTGRRVTQTAPRTIRDLWALDQYPTLVRLVQEPLGRLLLVTSFIALAKFTGVSALFSLVAAGFAFWPSHRTWIAIGGALVALMRSPRASLEATNAVLQKEGIASSVALPMGAIALLLYLGLTWFMLHKVRHRKSFFFGRRPVLSLLGITALLCAIASVPVLGTLLRAFLWTFISIFTAYMWFLAYALADQRSRDPGSQLLQMGWLQPFWGSTATPFGKGAVFLRKHQAKNPGELAVTQLKAIKLLTWALILLLLQRPLIDLVDVRIGIPKTEVVYRAFMDGAPYPIVVSWASLIWASFTSLLSLTIWGHQVIALARLAGFRLPRNTCRPLMSRTLADFWNRYYYYFKELLVEFFFFPTFLRIFRTRPHLRVFFATFMAAGVGNALYHFISDIRYVAIEGFWHAAQIYGPNAFSCAVLAIGIGVSQARISAGRKLPTTLVGSALAVLCVWSFHVGLRVFADETRNFPFGERCSFFISLLGF